MLPVLDELGAEIIQQTGLSPAGVYDVLNRNTLDPYNSARYEDTAVQHARDRLKTWEVEPPPENCALL